MNIPVSPDMARTVPSASDADSSVRQEVVPTQMTRPPAARRLFISSADAAGTEKNSVCMT